VSAGNEEGRKDDQDKVRMELIPVDCLWDEARVWTFGAKKYADRNWEKGFAWSRAYGAALRHLTRFWNSHDNDEETGLSHVAHAVCCLRMLQRFEKDKIGVDDRPI